MTITLEIAPEVQAELARQAATQGRAMEAYAASLLEEAVHVPVPPTTRRTGQEFDFSRNPSAAPDAVVEACERLKTFGKTHGLSLGGITLRELRDEARP